MAIDSGSDLRDRLSAVLDQLTPSPAPVNVVLRKAKWMRAVRRVLATAGIVAATAAAVVAVVIAPGLRHPSDGTAHHITPMPPRNGVVIGKGTISGRPWKVVVNPADNRLCAGVTGLRYSCVDLRKRETLRGLASLSGTIVAVPHARVTFGPPAWNSIFGTVGPDVTRISMRMSDGSTVNLRPVATAGYRWVGLVFRSVTVQVVRAVAYSGKTELGYSVPFIGGELRPGTYFVDWRRPDQAGPARWSTYIASGGSGAKAWSALVLAGPWGYCVSLGVPVFNSVRQNCWAASSLRSSAKVIMGCGSPPVRPRWIVGTAKPAVAYLRLTMAGGSTVRVAVTEVSGQKFYAMAISKSPVVVRWDAFDAAGHRLYGGRGAPDAGR